MVPRLSANEPRAKLNSLEKTGNIGRSIIKIVLVFLPVCIFRTLPEYYSFSVQYAKICVSLIVL